MKDKVFMRGIKRIISAIVALILVLGFMPSIPALAAETYHVTLTSSNLSAGPITGVGYCREENIIVGNDGWYINAKPGFTIKYIEVSKGSILSDHFNYLTASPGTSSFSGSLFVVDNINSNSVTLSSTNVLNAYVSSIYVLYQHTHDYTAAEWSKNETNHWHKCVVEGCPDLAGSKIDDAAHTWNATTGKCEICGKSKDIPSPTPSPSSKGDSAKSEEPVKDELEEREALELKMPVSHISIDKTQLSKEDEAYIPGYACNLSKFVTRRGFIKGVNVSAAEATKVDGNAAIIYSGRPFCFDGAIVKAIQDGKKDVIYYFTYKGHLYSITVPATVDASKVLENTGFAGPFYVGGQLGTTRLIR